jgi:hypothetical protein
VLPPTFAKDSASLPQMRSAAASRRGLVWRIASRGCIGDCVGSGGSLSPHAGDRNVGGRAARGLTAVDGAAERRTPGRGQPCRDTLVAPRSRNTARPRRRIAACLVEKEGAMTGLPFQSSPTKRTQGWATELYRCLSVVHSSHPSVSASAR